MQNFTKIIECMTPEAVALILDDLRRGIQWPNFRSDNQPLDELKRMCQLLIDFCCEKSTSADPHGELKTIRDYVHSGRDGRFFDIAPTQNRCNRSKTCITWSL